MVKIVHFENLISMNRRRLFWFKLQLGMSYWVVEHMILVKFRKIPNLIFFLSNTRKLKFDDGKFCMESSRFDLNGYGMLLITGENIKYSILRLCYGYMMCCQCIYLVIFSSSSLV